MTFKIFRDKSHLWRNPFTRQYHDPVVLYRNVEALPERTAAHLRGAFNMRQEVGPTGDGYAESQVVAACNDFFQWLEKKA